MHNIVMKVCLTHNTAYIAITVDYIDRKLSSQQTMCCVIANELYKYVTLSQMYDRLYLSYAG